MTPVLAVDWGRRRLGLAISDPSRTIGRPLPTLHVGNRRDAELGVARVAAEHGVEVIVLGLPLLPDGDEGESAAAVRRLARTLEHKGYQVRFQDERHSSEDAAEWMVGAPRDPGRVDQVAALMILTDFLESSPGEAP